MKKRKKTIILIALGIVIAGTFLFFSLLPSISVGREKVLMGKTRELKELKETFVPLRFRVTQRENGAIKAEFRFYSMIVDDIENIDMEIFSQDKEIAEPRFIEIAGNELFIDCIKIPNNNRLPYSPEILWVFPYRIFSDTVAPENALPLFQWYNNDGFPSIFNALEIEDADKKTLADIYANVQIADMGNALHDLGKVARFRLNVWYDLAVHSKKGSLEFISE